MQRAPTAITSDPRNQKQAGSGGIVGKRFWDGRRAVATLAGTVSALSFAYVSVARTSDGRAVVAGIGFALAIFAAALIDSTKSGDVDPLRVALLTSAQNDIAEYLRSTTRAQNFDLDINVSEEFAARRRPEPISTLIGHIGEQGLPQGTQAERIVFVGAAGSGKSVALRKLARAHIDGCGDVTRPVPFVVRLSLVPQRERLSDWIPRYIGKVTHRPNGEIHGALNRGDIAVLIDSLDEATSVGNTWFEDDITERLTRPVFDRHRDIPTNAERISELVQEINGLEYVSAIATRVPAPELVGIVHQLLPIDGSHAMRTFLLYSSSNSRWRRVWISAPMLTGYALRSGYPGFAAAQRALSKRRAGHSIRLKTGSRS
jgi:hypothetical protein